MPVLPSRMVPAVGVLQVGDGDPQVTLGRGERLVAEHFLDVAQVRAVLQEMRGAGVAPQVRRDFLFHARRLGVAGNQVTEPVVAKGKALARIVARRVEEPRGVLPAAQSAPGARSRSRRRPVAYMVSMTARSRWPATVEPSGAPRIATASAGVSTSLGSGSGCFA